METPTNYLGRGWQFPPRFDQLSGETGMVEGVKDINQSLEIILTTELGERLMRPRFGCGIKRYILEMMDSGAIGLLKNTIETAITYHEARIDLERVDLDFDAPEGRLLIELRYKVRNANSRFNFVFPYYLKEANTER